MAEKEDQEVELVLGNKQLLSVFFIVVILLGVFFTMGYVVGRNSSPVEAKQAEPYERKNASSAIPVAEPATPVVAPPVTVTEPQAGQTYLQVLAVAKSEADVLAEVLVKKGFSALVAPGPNEKIYRVLVGPARDATDISKLKTDLEAAGFKPFPKKY